MCLCMVMCLTGESQVKSDGQVIVQLTFPLEEVKVKVQWHWVSLLVTELHSSWQGRSFAAAQDQACPATSQIEVCASLLHPCVRCLVEPAFLSAPCFLLQRLLVPLARVPTASIPHLFLGTDANVLVCYMQAPVRSTFPCLTP
jgi:hypothetical protein